MRDFLRLLEYARRHRGAWLTIIALTLAGAGLAALQPWPVKLLVDQVLDGAPLPPLLQGILGTLSLHPTQSQMLIAVVVGGFFIFLVNRVVDSALTWLWTATGQRMVYELAQDLFARLQRQSVQFHKRHAVADLMSRVTVDSWCAYQVASTIVFSPAYALLTTAGMIFLMAQLDATLTWLAILVAPLMVGASFLLGKPLRAAAKLKREIELRIQSHIQQTLAGIPVVQAFVQEEEESFRFRSFAAAAIRSQQRSAFLGSINNLTSGLVTTLGSALILWVGARKVLAGQPGFTLGNLLIFLFYLSSLQTQIKALASVYTNLQGLSANTRRVAEILDSPGDLSESPAASPLPMLRQSSKSGSKLVQILNVTAGYEPGEPVLKDLTLEVQAGETIAIVGATGAGKTTLVNLLARFIEPWQGKVTIAGHDLRDVHLRSLREQIGLVFQDSFLFPVSIQENIAFGRPEASAHEIEAAAHAARAHDFIAALPEGYETVIGERGATLSVGQRQRLSIARALLKNAPILILDEPTSALDAETEHLLLEALSQLMQGRTTFVIAHRLSTVRRADRIIVLHEGRIVESGSHEELLAKSGRYAALHGFQNQQGVPLVKG